MGAAGSDRSFVAALLLTLGGFGIWQLIDIILIAVGRSTDRQGRPLRP